MTSDLCMSNVSIKLDIKDKRAGGSGKCVYRLIKKLTEEIAIFSLGPGRAGKSPGHLLSEEKKVSLAFVFLPPTFLSVNFIPASSRETFFPLLLKNLFESLAGMQSPWLIFSTCVVFGRCIPYTQTSDLTY